MRYPDKRSWPGSGRGHAAPWLRRYSQGAALRAVVAFYDTGEGPRHWLLKPGFGHCVAAVDDGTYWILVDARHGMPVFEAIRRNTYDMASFWRDAGYSIVETQQRTRPLRAPLVTANCVGLIKAALCIRAPFVITPYRLYRHLIRRE